LSVDGMLAVTAVDEGAEGSKLFLYTRERRFGEFSLSQTFDLEGAGSGSLLQFSQTGRFLAVGANATSGGQVRIFERDASTGEYSLLQELEHPTDAEGASYYGTPLALHEDGDAAVLAVGAPIDGNVYMYRLSSGKFAADGTLAEGCIQDGRS
jgi:hypothetical protein